MLYSLRLIRESSKANSIFRIPDSLVNYHRSLTGSAPDRDEAASLTLAAWLSVQEMNGEGAAVDELSQLYPDPSEPLLRCTCSLHYGKQLCYNLGREANQRNLLSFFER